MTKYKNEYSNGIGIGKIKFLKKTLMIFLCFCFFSCSKKYKTIHFNHLDKTFVKLNKADKIAYSRYELSNLEYYFFINDIFPDSAYELRSTTGKREYVIKKEHKKDFEKLYPDSKHWVKNYKYSFNEPGIREYFSNRYFENCPVVNISHKAAVRYCDWLTKEYNTGRKKHVLFRLPTEEEYLVLLKSVQIKYDSDNIDGFVTYRMNMKFRDTKSTSHPINSSIDGNLFLAPVGRIRKSYTNYGRVIQTRQRDIFSKNFKQNNLGIYHIIGNVAEMLDNGTVIGGSWDSFPSEVDSILINKKPHPTIGFRLVMEKLNN